MLVNAWRMRYKKVKPKKKKHKCYVDRNENLSELGYAGYQDYLKSDDWKAIRARKLATDPNCMTCGSTAAQVHHISYHPEVLLGLRDVLLVCLCDKCHEEIEVTGEGAKRTLREANEVLFSKALAKGRHKWVNSVVRVLTAGPPKPKPQKQQKKQRKYKRERCTQPVVSFFARVSASGKDVWVGRLRCGCGYELPRTTGKGKNKVVLPPPHYVRCVSHPEATRPA